MTTTQIEKLYKEAYTSKEAGLGSVLNWFPNMAKKYYQNNVTLFPGARKLAKGLWGIRGGKVLLGGLGLAGAGAIGYTGYNRVFNDPKENDTVQKFQKWIKDNPWKAGAIAAGLITSPLWLPAASNAIFGRNTREQIKVGPDRGTYQMGYYPGR